MLGASPTLIASRSTPNPGSSWPHRMWTGKYIPRRIGYRRKLASPTGDADEAAVATPASSRRPKPRSMPATSVAAPSYALVSPTRPVAEAANDHNGEDADPDGWGSRSGSVAAAADSAVFSSTRGAGSGGGAGGTGGGRAGGNGGTS